MSTYKTIVVGTDGSDTSMLAVDRAGAIASASGATLLVVTAYHPMAKQDVRSAQDALGADGHLVVGSTPAENVLRDASDRAHRAGAVLVETLAVEGEPVPVLDRVVADTSADLVVVGNVGLNTLAGRILGSVPRDVARRAGVDVLIVHTS